MSTKKQDLGKSVAVQHWTGREIEKSQAPDNINRYEKKKKATSNIRVQRLQEHIQEYANIEIEQRRHYT